MDVGGRIRLDFWQMDGFFGHFGGISSYNDLISWVGNIMTVVIMTIVWVGNIYNDHCLGWCHILTRLLLPPLL